VRTALESSSAPTPPACPPHCRPVHMGDVWTAPSWHMSPAADAWLAVSGRVATSDVTSNFRPTVWTLVNDVFARVQHARNPHAKAAPIYATTNSIYTRNSIQKYFVLKFIITAASGAGTNRGGGTSGAKCMNVLVAVPHHFFAVQVQ